MKYKVLFVILAICLVICIGGCSKHNEPTKGSEEYDWNNGNCINCDVRLDYIGCGHKYHYRCPECGKIYTFNAAQDYSK